MAGHSHWAGIEPKKRKADKQRYAVFSKINREITVGGKMGDQNRKKNTGIRSAIQAARSTNMHTDKDEKTIDKRTRKTENK